MEEKTTHTQNIIPKTHNGRRQKEYSTFV